MIEGNDIALTGPASARGATAAIEVVENDYNSAATGRIVGNRVTGPFAVAIALVNASDNAGVVPSFAVERNRFDGLAPAARVLSLVRRGRAVRPPAVRWDASQARDGRTIGNPPNRIITMTGCHDIRRDHTPPPRGGSRSSITGW